MGKPVFMRPVEITSANNSFTVQRNGDGSPTAKTLNVGVYSSVAAVLYGMSEVIDAMSSIGCTPTFYESNDELIFKLTYTGLTVKLVLDSDLQDILGAGSTTLDYAAVHTGSYRPSHTWVPHFEIASQEQWDLNQRDLFEGIEGRTGDVHGNYTGSDVYRRKFIFVNENASNLFDEAISYSYQERRTLSYFSKWARSAITSADGQPSAKGLYFYPDWDDIFTVDGTTIPGGSDGATHTYNGVQYNLLSSPSLHTYCQFDKSGYKAPGPSTPHGRLYYEVSFELHTMDPPDWQDPYTA